MLSHKDLFIPHYVNNYPELDWCQDQYEDELEVKLATADLLRDQQHEQEWE